MQILDASVSRAPMQYKYPPQLLFLQPLVEPGPCVDGADTLALEWLQGPEHTPSGPTESTLSDPQAAFYPRIS